MNVDSNWLVQIQVEGWRMSGISSEISNNAMWYRIDIDDIDHRLSWLGFFSDSLDFRAILRLAENCIPMITIKKNGGFFNWKRWNWIWSIPARLNGSLEWRILRYLFNSELADVSKPLDWSDPAQDSWKFHQTVDNHVTAWDSARGFRFRILRFPDSLANYRHIWCQFDNSRH